MRMSMMKKVSKCSKPVTDLNRCSGGSLGFVLAAAVVLLIMPGRAAADTVELVNCNQSSTAVSPFGLSFGCTDAAGLSLSGKLYQLPTPGSGNSTGGDVLWLYITVTNNTSAVVSDDIVFENSAPVEYVSPEYTSLAAYLDVTFHGTGSDETVQLTGAVDSIFAATPVLVAPANIPKSIPLTYLTSGFGTGQATPSELIGNIDITNIGPGDSIDGPVACLEIPGSLSLPCPPIPEPASFPLLVTVLLAMALVVRKRIAAGTSSGA